MKVFRIYYTRPEYFRDYISGFDRIIPQLATLNETHVFLREVTAENMDDVFSQSQGEIWSPNGEARGLIQSKGLAHTSMSVGDVIEDEDGKFYRVAPIGFAELN